MSITDNLGIGAEEPYQRQMTSYRRTRSAILEATKVVISSHGVRSASMIEIADNAQVSRATLYNHFRDKESVLRALIEFEIAQLFDGTRSLDQIALAISADSALAQMRRSDGAILANLASEVGDPLWALARSALLTLLGEPVRVELALRWLLGQVFAPLAPDAVKEQAAAI